jgi:transcriptional regulator with XRE-family HTH domain
MEQGNLKSRQIKAARALLDWSQEDLAGHSNLSIATIRKLELGHLSPRGKTSQAIRRAFEHNGLEFVEPDGVRSKPDDIVVYKGRNGAKTFFDDVYHTANKKNCEILLVCPSAKDYLENVLGDYRDIHVNRMAAIKKGKPFVKCILIEDDGPLWCVAYGEYRRISKNYIDSMPFYVYDDKYAIIMTATNPSPKITVIQSREIADAFRQQFCSMWDKAAPLTAAEKNADSAKKKSTRR